MTLPKIKNWYHATPLATAELIMQSGYLVPQLHKGDTSLGVFFAQTAQQAGQWCALRGHKEYVVFRVRTQDLDRKLMHKANMLNNEQQFGVVMRYLRPVRYTEVIHVRDNRNYDIPGVEIRTEGTQRLQLVVTDLQAFEAHVNSVPGLREYIDTELAKS
jgi:hypothetical protein